MGEGSGILGTLGVVLPVTAGRGSERRSAKKVECLARSESDAAIFSPFEVIRWTVLPSQGGVLSEERGRRMMGHEGGQM